MENVLNRAAFHRATEYGCLFSHASAVVYADLVGPTYPTVAAAADALARVLRVQGGPHGIQGCIVARIDDQWRDRRGHTATQIIRTFVSTGLWLPSQTRKELRRAG